MDDQGEKIVFLAREILNAGVPEVEPVQKKMTVTLSFKTLCFTTLLAAASGGLLSTVVHEHDRPLNRYERVELKALIFYAARLKGIKEDMLVQEVERRFGETTMDDLTAREFSSVRRFLQEKAQ